MSKENLKLSNKADIALFEAVTTAHEKYFDRIQSKIKINTKAKSLIYNALGDYVYDMNGCFLDDPDFQLGWYYDGDVRNYATQLLNDIENAENIIANLYLLYSKNKADFRNVAAEYEETKDTHHYMSDVSADYYNYIGGAVISCKPTYQDLMTLNNHDLDELNSILKECDLKPVSMFNIEKIAS